MLQGLYKEYTTPVVNKLQKRLLKEESLSLIKKYCQLKEILIY